MKEETVTGSYGIEGRYPFLDKFVVQEFLWLHNDLKNKNYKAPLYNYFRLNNYPFQLELKTGFNCGFTNVLNNYQKKNMNIKYKKIGMNNRKDLIVNYNEIKLINSYIKKNNIDFEKLINDI